MASTARTLFDDKSDTILSKSEMILDLPHRGCVWPAMVRVNVLTLNLALDRHVKENHLHDHSPNQRSTVLRLTDSGMSFTLIEAFQSALNSVSPIAHI